MEKCCSIECIAFTNWTLDRRQLFVSALWTHARVQGDLLCHTTLSAKRERRHCNCYRPSSAARRSKRPKKAPFSESSGHWKAGSSSCRHF